MDHNQESTMKTPFYMTYPMQNLYETEMEYEWDMQRMKDLYPREVKKILICVEDQCDELEYEGSMMYDEFPDRLMLEKIVDKIYERLIREGIIKRPEQMPALEGGIDRQQNPALRMECTESGWFTPPEGQIPPMPVGAQATEVCMQQRGPGMPPPPGRPGPGMPPPPGRPGPGMPPQPGWPGHNDPMWGLVGVLFNDEMYRRRCRNRRCRRWW